MTKRLMGILTAVLIAIAASIARPTPVKAADDCDSLLANVLYNAAAAVYYQGLTEIWTQNAITDAIIGASQEAIDYDTAQVNLYAAWALWYADTGVALAENAAKDAHCM